MNEPPFALRSMQALTTALASPLRLALRSMQALTTALASPLRLALRSMQVLTTALDSPLRLALLGSHAAGCEGASCPRVYEQFWHAGLSESEHFASSRAVDDLGAVLAQAQARKDAALVTNLY